MSIENKMIVLLEANHLELLKFLICVVLDCLRDLLPIPQNPHPRIHGWNFIFID